MHTVKVSFIVHSVNSTGMHNVKASSIVHSVNCTGMQCIMCRLVLLSTVSTVLVCIMWRLVLLSTVSTVLVCIMWRLVLHIVNSVICTSMHNGKVSSIVHSDADLEPDHGAQCGSALQIGGLTLLGQRSRVWIRHLSQWSLCAAGSLCSNVENSG